jgi:uncharacterized Tic20 family protein
MTMPPSPPGPPGGGAYQPGPPPGMPPVPTSEERTWALISHVGTLVAAWFAMGFLCPLIVMLTKGNESQFVRRHAVESLNFQISLLIYLVISAILVFLVVGIFMLIALGIFALVVIILATMAASNGQDYRYPLTIRLVS